MKTYDETDRKIDRLEEKIAKATVVMALISVYNNHPKKQDEIINLLADIIDIQLLSIPPIYKQLKKLSKFYEKTTKNTL